MSKILINVIIIFGTIVVLMVGYNFWLNKQNVTKEEFEEAHAILNKKIDSLEVISRRIEGKTDSVLVITTDIKKSVDSIKLGQKFIFDEVQRSSTKPNNQSVDFWSLFN